MSTQAEQAIVETVRRRHPDVQAVYLYGSFGTAHERPDSDVDIAVLLPPAEARDLPAEARLDLAADLNEALHRDIDLVNLRRVNVVLQKEVVMAERRIHTADRYGAEEFEMHVLSRYQKLNEERREILAEGLRTGSFVGE